MRKRGPAIDEEHATELADFADERGVSRDAAEGALREHYWTFHETTTDDTPASAIRRLAFRKPEWHPPNE